MPIKYKVGFKRPTLFLFPFLLAQCASAHCFLYIKSKTQKKLTFFINFYSFYYKNVQKTIKFHHFSSFFTIKNGLNWKNEIKICYSMEPIRKWNENSQLEQLIKWNENLNWIIYKNEMKNATGSYIKMKWKSSILKSEMKK